MRGTSGTTTPDRCQQRRRHDRRLPARRGGPAEHRPGPGFDGKSNNWIYLYYSPPLDTPVDDPATPPSTRATRRSPARRPTSRPSRADPALAVPLRRRRGRTRHASSRSSTSPSTAASAATSAATSSSTPTATSSCRPATTPTRSTPTATRRSTNGPVSNPAFDAQRSAGQHQRPARQDAADPAERGWRLHDPAGNLFAPARAEDPPGDLRDGAAQPVPHRDRPATPTRSTSPTTRPTPTRPIPHAGRPATASGRSITSRATTAGPTARPPSCPTSTTTSPPEESGAKFDCAAPVNDSPNNTGAQPAAAGRQPDVWYSYGVVPAVPGAGDGRHRPDGRPGLPLRPQGDRRAATRSPGRATTTACRSSTSGRVTTSRASASTGRRARRDRGRRPADRDRQPDGHGVRPRRRALRPGVRRRLLRARTSDAQLSRIDFIGAGGNRSPVPAIVGRPDGRQDAADVSFTSDGTVDPDGDRLRYAWDFDGDGDVDSRSGPDAHLHASTASTGPR